MSEFVSAPPPSGGVDWEGLKGKLLVIEPLSVEAGIKTSFGEKTAVRANVHVITAPGESEDYDDTLIFPTLLVSQTKNAINQKVVGRLGQGSAKPGQKPPWLLEEATADDLTKAQEWLARRVGAAVTTAAPPF